MIGRQHRSLLKVFLELELKILELFEYVEKLEIRINKNSRNSNKPPSSDGPFNKPKFDDKPKKNKKHGKAGGKKGHKGHRQQLLEPTKIIELTPEKCVCCSESFHETEPYFTHQVIELPEIKTEITHFILKSARCKSCGQINKAVVPSENGTGYGSRLSAMNCISAMIAELVGNGNRDGKLFYDPSKPFQESIRTIDKGLERHIGQ